jgi:serine/threonine protein kinase/tetratricopeptide (TPR) repeat protein
MSQSPDGLRGSDLLRGQPSPSVLQVLLRPQAGDSGTRRTLRLPGVGQELFGFRLQRELGRGAFARVFLATQADLASRPVVLKVSGIKGHEPQTLAQLQHTHIVPIHSVHEDRAAGLRAVCMPYFGGASLSSVLQKLWTEDPRPMYGRQLMQALEAAQVTAKTPPSAEVTTNLGSPGAAGASGGSLDPAQWPAAAAKLCGPTPKQFLAGQSYIRAAAWISARLAAGLQHAHQRGVLHRDVKPSNILLGSDGQPMLLDFNVSQDAHSDPNQAAANLGGTVAYMAPEHLQAMATRDPDLVRQLDHRADIYSLGMVLYEMVAGCSPFEQSASYSVLPVLIQSMAVERSCIWPSLREKRADIPWSLESIGRKCLAPDPAQRYQQAEHLAEDLRCFLEDRPLKHAPELSRVERVRKWMRRHPRMTSSASVASAAVLLLAALGVVTVGIRDHLATTRAQLATAQAQERRRSYEEGTVRALCLVNTTNEVQDHLPRGLAVCEDTLALYGVLDRPDWQDGPDWQRLEPEERQQLAEDTRELILLLAWGRARSGASNPEAIRQALDLLDRAEAIRDLPPSRALGEDRAVYLERLGDAAGAKAAREHAQALPLAGARDHYWLATTYARGGRYAEAVRELDQALRLNPRHYWSAFQRGICHLELGKPALAAGDFGTCIGLWPEFAWGYFNRGAALDRRGDKQEAIDDYTAALERDPQFVLAYLNRGRAELELTRYESALADFQQAAVLGNHDAALHAGLGVALEGLGRGSEADDAFCRAFQESASASEEVQANIRSAYGFAVAARLPEKAREAFVHILRHNPLHPQALYGRAMILAQTGRDRDALAFFNRAIGAAPNFVEARRFRAVILARCGDFDTASQDINWCLEREPDGGATLYAAACVAAHAARKATDPGAARLAANQAITFLEKAFGHNYGRDKAATDPDLKSLQGDREFQELLQRAKGSERNQGV